MQWEKGNNLLLANNAEDFNKLLSLAYARPPHGHYPFQEDPRRTLDRPHGVQQEDIERLAAAAIFSGTGSAPDSDACPDHRWGDQDKLLDVGGVAFLEKNLKKYRTVIMEEMGHSPCWRARRNGKGLCGFPEGEEVKIPYQFL